MKKLVRIIFLLLLIHYAFGQCSGDENSCGGTPPENHVCIFKSNECTAVQICSTVKDEDKKELNDEKCKEYAISAETKENYVCVSNEEGSACEEKAICSKMAEEKDVTDEKCRTYIAYNVEENTRKSDYICFGKDNEGTIKCTENYLCGKVPSDASEKDCSSYPVTDPQINVYIENSGGTLYVRKNQNKIMHNLL